MTWEDWLTPLGIVGAGLAIGLAVEWLGMRRLRAWAARTTWRGDDLLVAAVRGLPVLWATLIALHLAATAAPLPPEPRTIIHRVLVVGLVISATLVAMRMASGIIGGRGGGQEGRGATIFANIARTAVLVVGLLVVFQTLGIAITPVLTALGVGGLAVALALQPTLSNLFSGIQILMTRKINPGDLIRLSSGEEGVVTDISWRETTIRTLTNNLVMIPNANLATSQVTNYSLPQPEIGFGVTIPIAHGNDLERVRAALQEEAGAVQAGDPGALPGAGPQVRVGGVSESAIEMLVLLQAKEFPAQFAMRSALLERALLRFAREGIALPQPARILTIRPPHPPGGLLPPSMTDEGQRAPAASDPPGA